CPTIGGRSSAWLEPQIVDLDVAGSNPVDHPIPSRKGIFAGDNRSPCRNNPSMTDPRYKKLATLLVEYSTELKKGDRVLLDMIDVPDEFTIEIMRAARKAGAIPLVEVRHTRITREVIRKTNDRHATLVRDLELSRMKKVQA